MELKILSATSNDLFLQPRIRSTDSDIDDNEPDCATLQVIIQLSIPAGHSSPSKLSSLSVSLVGYESIGFPRGGFEQNQPYSSKKNIEEATDLQLQAGNIYQFETSFAVNHNTAPYQRCKYGRLHQKLQAKATFPGLLGKKTIIAEKVSQLARQTWASYLSLTLTTAHLYTELLLHPDSRPEWLLPLLLCSSRRRRIHRREFLHLPRGWHVLTNLLSLLFSPSSLVCDPSILQSEAIFASHSR